MDELARIKSLIFEIRGVKVILDKDLADLYHVTTGNLNKAVKRNIRRFPSDFMFQLTKEEWDSLRFQFGIIESGRGKYTKYLPHAFTEEGVAMLSGVLHRGTLGPGPVVPLVPRLIIIGLHIAAHAIIIHVIL